MAETTGTTTVTYNYGCPYRSTCSDNGKKCETCNYNPKRSYYEPVDPYYPYIPYIPYPTTYPYWYPTTITWGVTTTTHYQSV